MSCTVVLANDDVNARIIAETLLQLRGLRVRCAGDDVELCNLLLFNEIAVVVLDVTLPGIHGLLPRLSHRLGPRRTTAVPRLVLVTEPNDTATQHLVFELGADIVLRKPVPSRQFVETVERLAKRAAPEAA